MRDSFNTLEEQPQGLAIVHDRARTGSANTLKMLVKKRPNDREERIEQMTFTELLPHAWKNACTAVATLIMPPAVVA